MKLFLIAAFPLLLASQQAPQDPDRASMEGQVLNGISGEPLRKARVTLRMNVATTPAQRQQPLQQPPPPQPGQTVTTDSAGKFVFVNLEPGDYQLTARHDGFADTQRGTGGGRKNDAILLGRGDRKADFTIKLTPFGVVAGRVTDEDGDPIRNVGVTLMSYRYTNAGRELVDGRNATTDDLGDYRIYDVPPGKYFLKAAQRGPRLSFSADETEAIVATYFPGVTPVSAASPQEIAAGQQLRGLNFTVRKARAAVIRGKIIAPPDATGVSVGVMIVSSNGSSSSSNSMEDKSGKFELFGVAPGPTYITGDYSVAGVRHSVQLPVEVGTSDINGLELRPLAPLEVAGQLRIEGESTVKPSQIQVSLQSRRSSQSMSPKDDGALIFRQIPSGTYQVMTARTGPLYIKGVQWGTVDITDGDLDLTNGVPPHMELSIVLGSDGGEVSGTVAGEKGEPMEGAVVTLVPRGSHKSRGFFRNATTDVAGKFTLRGIAPGSYKVFAWDRVNNNAVMFDPDFLRPYEGAGQVVEIQPNGKHSADLKIILNKEQ